MNRSKFGRFIDNTSITLLSVIFSFVLIKKLISNNIHALILSLIVGFWVIKIVLYFQNKKYTRLSIEKQEIENIKKCNLELRKLTTSEQLKFFKEALKNKNIREAKKGIIINNQVIIFILLHEECVTPYHLFTLYSKLKQLKKHTNTLVTEITIICNQITQEATNYITQFSDVKFTIFTPIETYAMLKKLNHIPELPLNKKTQKMLNFALFKHSFVKKQAQTFFKCSIILYIASLFIPFTTYYLIAASLCLFLSVICLCFGTKETPVSNLSKELLL